jgi:hypothetical protein
MQARAEGTSSSPQSAMRLLPPIELIGYLQERFARQMETRNWNEGVEAHLEGGRADVVIERIEALIQPQGIGRVDGARVEGQERAVRPNEAARSRSRRYPHVRGSGNDRRDGHDSQTHPLQVKFDGFTYRRLGFPSRFAGRDATRKVRHVRRPVPISLFKNNRVLFHSLARPACFQTLFSVFGCTSSLGCPLTVTIPDLLG